MSQSQSQNRQNAPAPEPQVGRLKIMLKNDDEEVEFEVDIRSFKSVVNPVQGGFPPGYLDEVETTGEVVVKNIDSNVFVYLVCFIKGVSVQKVPSAFIENLLENPATAAALGCFETKWGIKSFQKHAVQLILVPGEGTRTAQQSFNLFVQLDNEYKRQMHAVLPESCPIYQFMVQEVRRKMHAECTSTNGFTDSARLAGSEGHIHPATEHGWWFAHAVSNSEEQVKRLLGSMLSSPSSLLNTEVSLVSPGLGHEDGVETSSVNTSPTQGGDTLGMPPPKRFRYTDDMRMYTIKELYSRIKGGNLKHSYWKEIAKEGWEKQVFPRFEEGKSNVSLSKTIGSLIVNQKEGKFDAFLAKTFEDENVRSDAKAQIERFCSSRKRSAST